MLWIKTIYFENGTKIVRQSVTYARAAWNEFSIIILTLLHFLPVRRKEPTVQISFMDNFALLEPANSRPSTQKSIDAGGGEALNGNLKIIP